MRARVTSETEPLPFRTLLVVWKLTPDLAATSLTDTCRVALCTLTEALLWPGERSPYRPSFARLRAFTGEAEALMNEPSEVTDGDAAPAEKGESDDHPMPPDGKSA